MGTSGSRRSLPSVRGAGQSIRHLECRTTLASLDLPLPYRFCGTNTITRGDTTLDVPPFCRRTDMERQVQRGQSCSMLEVSTNRLSGTPETCQ